LWVRRLSRLDFSVRLSACGWVHRTHFGDSMCTESRAFQDDDSSAHLNTFGPGPIWFPSENELLTIREATLVHSVSIPCLFLALINTRRANVKIVSIESKEELKNGMNYEACQLFKKKYDIEQKNVCVQHYKFTYTIFTYIYGNFDMVYFCFQEIH